jgi:uncharacterized protein YxjI
MVLPEMRKIHIGSPRPEQWGGGGESNKAPAHSCTQVEGDTMDANVAPQWLQDYYTVRQKVLAIGKTYFIDDASNRQIGYCKMKIFKLKEDIRIYTDDTKNHELLSIKQEQILDWSGTFKVTDSQTGQVCGFFQRRPLKSMFRDEWIILDANKNEYGKILEDSGGMAMLRRFIKFIPKKYNLISALLPPTAQPALMARRSYSS